MRRITVTDEQLANIPLRELLSVNDYFYVVIARGGTRILGAFVRFSNDREIFFCTNTSSFDGCFCCEREELGFEYSWSCGSPSLRYARDVVDDNGHGYSFEGIASEEEVNRHEGIGSKVMFLHNEYTANNIYRRIRDYHFSHTQEFNDLVRADKTDNYRIGVELEVECKNADFFAEVTQDLQSNWLFMEHDGSLNSYGIEFITIPLLPKHAKQKATWTDLVEYLKPRAVSWDSGRCGLHIHIGRGILGTTAEEQSETLGKLLYLYHHFMKQHPLNVKIFGREKGYDDREGKVAVADSVKTLGSEVLKIGSIKDKVKTELLDRSNTSRYFDINVSNRNTIEFRKGRGSINALRITAVIEWCELYCLYARKVKWQNISDTDFLNFVTKKMSKSSSLSRYFGSVDVDC
jgi:hypothetical protein